MSVALILYSSVAAFLLLAAVPLVANCAWEACHPAASGWNRRAALLTIPLVLAVCALWPVALVLYLNDLRQKAPR